ncbi:MAG: YeeE/YedE family protein [Endozoicomonas sp.]
MEWPVIVNFTPFSGLAGGALIGLGAALLLFANGRIAGISGIVSNIKRGDSTWRLLFIAGVIISGTLLSVFARETPVPQGDSPALLLLAGLLVGFGTRLGSGCTSGHGVCGLSRLSLRSLVAVCIFMGTAMVTVFLTRNLV